MVLDLIPTLGYPGSDNQIFAKDVNSAPAINIGRLAATRADQILTYLNKVKVYESSLVDPKNNDDLYWGKNITPCWGVPGAGGEGFDNFVNGFKSILKPLLIMQWFRPLQNILWSNSRRIVRNCKNIINNVLLLKRIWVMEPSALLN